MLAVAVPAIVSLAEHTQQFSNFRNFKEATIKDSDR